MPRHGKSSNACEKLYVPTRDRLAHRGGRRQGDGPGPAAQAEQEAEEKAAAGGETTAAEATAAAADSTISIQKMLNKLFIQTTVYIIA